MQRARIVSTILAVFGLAGCYSFDSARSQALTSCTLATEKGEVLEHVFLQNSGWFLFDRYPLVCGSIDDDAFLPWTFFKNDASLAAIEGKLAARARARKARVVHENVISRGETLITLPGLQVPAAIPFRLSRSETQISAVLMKCAEEETE
jgi:hypothetical protein